MLCSASHAAPPRHAAPRAATCCADLGLTSLSLPPAPPSAPVPANADAHGYLEAEKPGLKHYAVRDSGRESTYRPPAANVAPRAGGWARGPAGAAPS